MMALRRHQNAEIDDFPRDVQELQRYFADAQPDQAVRAVPGQGLQVPLWLLGSSLYSAQLAAALGLPFAFAAHFALDMLLQAMALYREKFKPSSTLNKPYAMVCVNVIAAESERDARFLFTSVQQQFLNLRRGQPGPLPEQVQDMGSLWSPAEQFGVDQALRLAIVGDNSKVQHGLRSLLRETKAD